MGKTPIPKSVRNSVWIKYIGEEFFGNCYCCSLKNLTCFNFACGHIISEKDGGEATIENLRPICTSCNSSMGTNNMEDFKCKYGYYSKSESDNKPDNDKEFNKSKSDTENISFESDNKNTYKTNITKYDLIIICKLFDVPILKNKIDIENKLLEKFSLEQIIYIDKLLNTYTKSEVINECQNKNITIDPSITKKNMVKQIYLQQCNNNYDTLYCDAIKIISTNDLVKICKLLNVSVPKNKINIDNNLLKKYSPQQIIYVYKLLNIYTKTQIITDCENNNIMVNTSMIKKDMIKKICQIICKKQKFNLNISYNDIIKIIPIYCLLDIYRLFGVSIPKNNADIENNILENYSMQQIVYIDKLMHIYSKPQVIEECEKKNIKTTSSMTKNDMILKIVSILK